MITARHWVRTSLEDIPWPLELRDGAQAMPISSRNWADHEVVIKHGVRTLVVVCCGPAAPMPYRPGSGLDKLSRISTGTYWP